jgi:DNA-binding NarL/FixJ family response regulator
VKFFDFSPLLPHLPFAACRDIENPNLFFPESRAEERKSLQAIRNLCDGCIERKECLDYALEQQVPYGIWAGYTWEQRKRMIGNARQQSPIPTRAELVRRMFAEGAKPKEIAKALEIELSYVTQVLVRAKAKLEGEIQSQLTNEKPGEESPLSSGFPQ